MGQPIAGSFAQYMAVPAIQASKKPGEISHAQAAAIALVGTTAWQALDQLKVGEGTKVLITGGASAVGAVAVQLAKLRGAWVATTGSSRTVEYVSGLGAD